MEESIFAKIIKGEIPCHKVYEDDKVLAFLDISPYTAGHTLVIPKDQTDHIWDLDNELYLYVMKIAKRVAERQREVIKPKRVGIMVEGFAVPHAHVHIVPMYGGLEYTIKNKVEKPTETEFAEMAKKLAF